MMPPTRIEQLNNFQDAVQSPDGLDRLRALQSIEQALPSSQGLMGMPQVQAPMPMVPRQYGGEVGTGGFVGLADDGTQIFNNTQEGIQNRALHGGIMQGFTPTTSQPTSNIDTTSVEQPNIGPYNLSDYSNLDIPETIKMESSPQTPFRSPSGKIPYDLYVPPAVTDYAQGHDMKDVPYLVANKMAQDAGADRFIYNKQWAKTEALPDNYDYNKFGTQVYKPSILRPNVDYSSALQHGYTQHNLPAPNPESEYAKAAQGLFKNPYSGAYEYSGKGTSGSPFVTRKNVQLDYYGRPMKEGGQIISKQYGGEVGTGGLLNVLDDGTQVFDHTQEGIQNRALHGGMLEGWNQQTSTAPSSSTSSSFSGGPTAAGTLASGTSAAPSVLPKTAVDNSFLAPVMQLDNVQQRGGIYNASDIRDAGIDLNRPGNAPETIVQQGQAQVGSMYRDPHTGKIPYALYQPQPINTFGQGYDLKDMDYFTANALALNEGADRFIYNDEYAAVDPGLLSNYNYSELGTKPWGASMERDKIREATIGMPGTIYESVDTPEVARAKALGFTQDYHGNYTVNTGTTRAERYRQLAEMGVDMNNPYTRMQHGFKHGGSLSDTAEGLASFGRYGDNILVHMNPEELDGLASLGNLTYNPVTGLPEAFSFGKIFKSIRKLAPIALAIAAPYAFGVAGGTALQIGAASGAGSFLGNIIAGAKPKDALKSGLFSGLTAGFGSYLGGAPSGLGSSGASNVGTQGFANTGLGGINQGVTPNIAGASSAGTNLTKASMANTGYGGINKLQPSSVGSEFTSPPTTTGLSNRVIDVPKQSFQLAQTQPVQPTFNPDIPTNMTIRGDSLNQYVQSQQPVAKVAPQQSTSIFAEGGLSKENLSRIGSEIGEDYGNWKGAAKIVGMDIMQPDWEEQYAAEAAAKNQQLTDAGYTVETGFNGQTVIRDSSGVQMPRTLTVQQILDRALGKAPRSKMVADYKYGPSKAEGGLISLKHGGEFSGMVPGQGHGMEDNVYMPIVEKEQGSQVGTLAVSPSEYVVDSYTMAALGNGNADAGAKVMDNVVKHVRKKAYGNTEQPNEISGLQALQPMLERV